MSNHSMKIYRDLIGSFQVIVLTEKRQTDGDDNITASAEVNIHILRLVRQTRYLAGMRMEQNRSTVIQKTV